MFTEKDMDELVKFKSSNPVISLYINTEPSEGNAETYKLRMRSMLKDVDLPSDVSLIERYFDHEYDWTGRGVALFSCSPGKLFRFYPLFIPVSDRINVDDKPLIMPLASLLDNYGGVGIVLVDKQNMKLFTFHLGYLEEIDSIEGVDVKRTKRGGASTFPGRRGGQADITGYSGEITEKNLKDYSEKATRFFEDSHIRRIVIGGTEKNATMFFNKLPRQIQSLVLVTTPISMNTNTVELQKKIMKICNASGRKREDQIVDSLLASAARGDEACLGLHDTLCAINDAKVKSIAISKYFQEIGYRCRECDFLSVDSNERCRVCQKPLEQDKNIVEHAVSKAICMGGSVNVVVENQLLASNGKIGAILRY